MKPLRRNRPRQSNWWLQPWAILIEGDAEEMSLDEIIAAEEKAASTDATISAWIK